MHQFDEGHPALNGFSTFYADTVLPGLQVIETARARKLRSAIQVGVGLLIVGSVVSALIYPSLGDKRLVVLPIIIAAIIALIFGGSGLRSVRGETKTALMGQIADFVGWQFAAKLAVSPDITTFMQNHLLRPHDRARFEDSIMGQVHGADFELFEAHLERRRVDDKGRTQWTTVFRGSVMAIDFHRKFLGRTVVLRDRGIFNAGKKSGMKRVGLEDPVFEKIFEAYGTDQVEARYLLTPTFMQRLVDLETSVDGKSIRFGFVDQKLLITVETSNRFEVGSMLGTLTAPERTQKILNEISAIFHMIDGILKPLERRFKRAP